MGEVMAKEIKVCPGHNFEVPLISTFAFNGAEYWCPYCGHTTGIMGDFEEVTETEELVNRRNEYERFSYDFLKAKSSRVCISLVYKGERMKPEDLPKSVKDMYAKSLKAWEYNIKK